MGKDSKFNFNNTSGANELSEEMSTVDYAVNQKEEKEEKKVAKRLIIKKKPKKANDKDWTLVQCRLSNDLNRRLSVYTATYSISKNDFIEEAVRRLLNVANA